MQERKAELRDIEQKLADIQVVEQWQQIQELCSKVLPWEQVCFQLLSEHLLCFVHSSVAFVYFCIPHFQGA